jgi:lipoprotein-anchoring transpeptidase ErfK/SrfK
MFRRAGLILILFIILSSFLLINYFPPLQKPLPQHENKRSSQSLVYSNAHIELYENNNQLILFNDKEGSEYSIKIPENNLKFIGEIKQQNAGDAPQLDKVILLGVILNGKNKGYIFELEPELKLREDYPLIDNNNNHYIVIKKSSNQLYYYQKGTFIKKYKVSTGKESWYTPEGSFHIANKIPYPKGKAPDAPMGSRWMGLAVPYSADKRGNKKNGGPDTRSPIGHKYGIHGTNDESTIGTHASGGCIRMYNKSIAELYDMVPIGTRVQILP